MRISLATSIAAAAVALSSAALVAPSAYAITGQGGAPEVVINPGGGAQADASDGLRFTINQYDDVEGQDNPRYRNTTQYCCTAGGPMLNVGGTLFGQAGPAYDSDVLPWTSITVLSTSGSTVQTPAGQSTASSQTGDGSATVRYVATLNGLDYIIDRTVSYTFPNDYVTDSYSYTIPQGNTAAVKFYLGGDTAPGDSDSGYGIALALPVRSIISLNTSSHILFGMREIAGSAPFDGATSQSYYNPYETVETGGDIGFVVENQTHDAGLMVQWNLGSTPGTYTRSLQQFVNEQGTNLTASYDRSVAAVGDVANLEVQVQNTLLDPGTGLGFTLDLPAGLTAAGAVGNTCGGLTTGGAGATRIVLVGGLVSAADSCLVTVPVRASSPGSYVLSSSLFSGVTGADNIVGTSGLAVSPAAVVPPTTAAAAVPVPTCRGKAATIVARPGVATVGTAGPDVIVGTDGADVIDGAGGDDLVCALAGDDTVRGSGGKDTLYGGSGDDVLRGGKGRDLVVGQSGNDRLSGGKGRDRVKGGTSADRVRGGKGADRLSAGKGGDRVIGGPGKDRIKGGAGKNKVTA